VHNVRVLAELSEQRVEAERAASPEQKNGVGQLFGFWASAMACA